ncbi:Svf1 survival factor [Candida orthopsilosis Co 90-125]|uniref:Svf1 survival factor n=1 Tax=Candida orthopsilosis (strain 90-125) TaxID=1136231 RepID=H8X236_CANO9|nr:Svf1 survival factor [Candida orthopsilosis Co 90-125]CCG22757.1 Svf1 survival factor [Candida orthopsilosis Co 90-125]
MLKYLQGTMASALGTQEPEYGPDSIHPVTNRVNKESGSVYRSTKPEDFNWQSPNYTNVETQTFYFTDLATGNVGFAQIIHSNVMGVHTTAQFTFRLYNINDPSKNIWTSTRLENFKIVDGFNFEADNLKFEMVDGRNYKLKSFVCDESIVELEVERLTDGVIFGDDGMTFYGDDINQPWGSMRHVFWPKCTVNGRILTKKLGEVKITNGYTMFVMALQGMKPHHAAKSWNFMNFQSSNYAAVQMEFTTPKSYANTKIDIGIVTDNEKILFATIDNEVVHLDSEIDSVGWPVPKAIEFNYVDPLNGNTIAKVTGPLKNLVERVDVMAEIPQFVKNIVSGVAGAKPYIYQYSNEFEIEILDKEKDSKSGKAVEGKEKGIGFTEVTFISE